MKNSFRLYGGDLSVRRTSALGGCLTIFGVWVTWIKFLIPGGNLLGDGGDTKFNLYALEHAYLVVRGAESLWDASFYWPARGVVAFSDIHLGSSIFYVIPRLLGLGQIDSMSFWLAAGLLLSALSAYCAALVLRIDWMPAMMAGLIYGSALPLTAQAGHAQLMHRWAAPWVILAALPLSSTKVGLQCRMLMAVFGLSLQFLCSPILAIGTMIVAFFVAVLSYALGLKMEAIDDIYWIRLRKWFFCGALLGGLLAFYVAFMYAHFKSNFGITRLSEEILDYSPSLQALVLADHSNFWGLASRQVPIAGGRHEMQMFIGIVSLSMLLYCVMCRVYLRKLFSVLMLSIVLVFILVMRIYGSSFYVLLAHIPGFDSVRTPVRFWLICLFPIGIMCALGLNEVRDILGIGKRLIQPLILALLIVELSSVDVLSISRDEFTKPTEIMVEEVKQELQKRNPTEFDAFLYVRTNSSYNYSDLDAMMAARDLGVNTVNGYSGFAPFGGEVVKTCEDAETLFSKIKRVYPNFESSRILFVGATCP
jgi:hypothetical protein